jgi:hypothetical protein
MTLTSIANTTGPKTPSPASKAGGVSHPATTAAQSSSSPLHTRRNRHHLSSVRSLRFKPRIDFLCQSPMRVAHGALRKACAACEHVQGVMPQASPQPWYGSSPPPLHPRQRPVLPFAPFRRAPVPPRLRAMNARSGATCRKTWLHSSKHRSHTQAAGHQQACGCHSASEAKSRLGTSCPQ